MSWKLRVIFLAVGATVAGLGWRYLSDQTEPSSQSQGPFLGSSACRSCHESFYQKWATSWHGLAMQPYTPEFAKKYLTPQAEPVEIRGRKFQIEIRPRGAVVREQGPEGEKSYPIEHALGGKNLFYFLTPFPGGRLQVLPLAYDTREKEWYDSAGSMVRHFQEDPDAAVDWTDRLLTFNTSCYSCHVSQLSRNYSSETDSYNTTWSEPGINCESCHGPGERHVEVCVAAGDKIPEDVELIVTRHFNQEQTNSMCAHCHSKMTPLTETFVASKRFFDHFNLVSMEDRDMYPDGREIGENYTFGLSLMSSCVNSGQLDCMHCHTSSGRDRHVEDPDRACMPCHEAYVKDPAPHTFHKADGEGSRCRSCHMPMTAFARMRRHDHSLLPPTPATTIEFKSPNACNLCHDDQDAQWADEWVRKWYPRDYQAPVLARARLVDQARKHDWARLTDMVAYVSSPDRSAMFTAGLLRLLDACPLPEKWPAYFKALDDSSPLVRAAAVNGLANCPLPEAFDALVRGAGDDYRLVRVESALGLARRPVDRLSREARALIEKALAERVVFLESRRDDPLSLYNLGNFYQDRMLYDRALDSYRDALKLDPKLVPAHVNLAMVHAMRGESSRAEFALREAIRAEPSSAEANFNLGLLLAEEGRRPEAETCLRVALKSNPQMAAAAYNLGVLLADEKPTEGIELLRRAAELRADEPRYAYSLAFYLYREGQAQDAIAVLRDLVDRSSGDGEAIALLGAIYQETGRTAEAIELFRSALTLDTLSPAIQQDLRERLAFLQQ